MPECTSAQVPECPQYSGAQVPEGPECPLSDQVFKCVLRAQVSECPPSGQSNFRLVMTLTSNKKHSSDMPFNHKVLADS